MNELNFAVVGTRFIADIVFNSIDQPPNATLTAVSSRKLETAQAFVADRAGVERLIERAAAGEEE